MEEEIKEYVKKEIKIQEMIIQRSKEIQSRYNFEIPNYVLDEWYYAEKDNNFYNVIGLLNLAKMNNRISQENVSRLKEDIKKSYF